MTKELSAYQAAKKTVKGFDEMGGFPDDFARKISKKVPLPQAKQLLAKFPALIKADGREARRKGSAFEAAHGDGAWFALPLDERVRRVGEHREKSAKATSRDWKFAGGLPKSMRQEFYDLVKSEKEYQHGWGASTVSHNRTMKRLDDMLSTPQGRFAWEINNNIAASRRFELGEF